MTPSFFICVVIAFIVIVAVGLVLDQWHRGRDDGNRTIYSKPARNSDQVNP